MPHLCGSFHVNRCSEKTEHATFYVSSLIDSAGFLPIAQHPSLT